ncbi:MAG: ABC transporter ATP-binding protein [Spirochaetia bacterium]|nr:ABC transporter ATP-binding protein [Spirochaetota bacterium]MDW8113198.1 ABC transporter ATP-binding protein [Spirochaetia bacterium]
MEPVIVLDNVTKTYPHYGYIKAGFKTFLFNIPKAIYGTLKRRFTALENISFEVYKGECLGIIGRNGAGKSTLLGLIAGVIKPDRGTVIVKGRVLPLLELGAGFHPELTGRENIILNGILLGMTKKEVLKKLDQIIDFSELREFIDQPLRTYSSGMVARLGFSVVAHLEPDILLIDEVLAVGDINFQKKCMDKIMSFRKNSVTILLVTHVPDQVEKLCDRAIWIDEHRIKAIGNHADICKLYKESLV